MSNKHNDKPLYIKELVRRSRAGYTTLHKMMNDEGITICRTAIRRLVIEGVVPKKTSAAAVSAFFVNTFPREFASLGIEPKQLWDEYTEDASSYNKDTVVTPEKSDFEKLIQKLMEAPTMLRQEVLEYYGLTRATDPFTPDVKEIFRSSWHNYGIEMLEAATEMGSMIVISGESGSGKSTVVADFANKAGRNVQIITPETDASHLRDIDILQACVYEMSEEKPKRGMEALVRQVKKLLKDRATSNIKVILIINNAHDMKIDAIRYVKRLWEIDGGFKRLMGVALVGQNELESRLFDSARALEVREFTKRATLVKLGTMNEQTRPYVEHRIKTAGGKVSAIISDEALDLLSDALCAKDAKGKLTSTAYPLAINELMTDLMDTAYEYSEKVITPNTLRICGYIDSKSPVRQVK